MVYINDNTKVYQSTCVILYSKAGLLTPDMVVISVCLEQYWPNTKLFMISLATLINSCFVTVPENDCMPVLFFYRQGP